MCLEAQAVAIGATLRDPPYVYTLCPQQRYPIVNETLETIFPLLNNTILQCGSTGASSENCIIEGGFLQLEIGDSSRDPNHETPIRNMDFIQFFGLTFRNGRSDPRLLFGPSVWARAPPSTTALFRDCHWNNGSVGSSIILNSNRDDFGVSIPGMTMLMQTCTFSNLDINTEGFVAFSVQQARLELTNVQISNNNLRLSSGQMGQWFRSVVIIRDSSLNDNTVGRDDDSRNTFFAMGDGGSVLLSNVQVRRNHFQEFIRQISSSQLFVETTTFSNNTGTTMIDCNQSPDGEVSVVTVERSRFENALMSSMIFGNRCELNVDSSFFNSITASLAVGAIGGTLLRVTSSCFIGDQYFYPIYFSGAAGLFLQDVYSQDLQVNSGCDGASVEPSGDTDCLTDPLVCRPDCTAFDATSCSLINPNPTPFPTAAPPVSFPVLPTIPATASPTREFPGFFQPTVSQPPSESLSPSFSAATGAASWNGVVLCLVIMPLMWSAWGV